MLDHPFQPDVGEGTRDIGEHLEGHRWGWDIDHDGSIADNHALHTNVAISSGGRVTTTTAMITMGLNRVDASMVMLPGARADNPM